MHRYPEASGNTLQASSVRPLAERPPQGSRSGLRALAIPVLAGVVVVMLCVNLGFWQLRRAEYKDMLQSRLEAGTSPHALEHADKLAEWQRVTLRGEWLPDRVALLDNRLRQGRAGFEVLTPLRLEHDGGIVIVNRGWIADLGDRKHLPQVSTPHGSVEISGIAVTAVAPGFSLAAPRQDGPIWQKADLPSFARLLGQPVGAWLVRQESPVPDALDRNWPSPDFGADRHRAYAWQWFAMAATALALCIGHTLRALRRQPSSISSASPTSSDTPRNKS